MCSLKLLAFTTILGWDCYAEKSCEYLFNGSNGRSDLQMVYIGAVLIGPFLTLSQVWTIADFNALMAAPNLVGIFSAVFAQEALNTSADWNQVNMMIV